MAQAYALRALLALGLALVACGDTTLDGIGGDDAGSQGPPAPAGDDAGLLAPADGGPVGGDAGAPDDAGPAPADAGFSPDDGGPDDGGSSSDLGFVRFVAVGDTGKGNEGQLLVAAAMVEVCAERGGCDFGLLLGDNIYNSGVDSVDDEQWQTKFETPYAEVPFPFYGTLGNHDYGAPPVLDFLGGIGISPSRSAAQVEYAAISEKLIMPDTHYRVVEGPIELVSLNTTSMFWADLELVADTVGFTEENERMLANLAQWESESESPWRIAFGHHPYLSNGPHGNAGRYDGVILDGLIGSGTELKAFFEEYVIGRFDVFLCGHDHSLQDLGTVGGTDLFLSGGGASHTDLPGGNEVLWQADRRGFLLVEANAEEITFTFVVVPDAEDGATEPWSYAHTRTITRE